MFINYPNNSSLTFQQHHQLEHLHSCYTFTCHCVASSFIHLLEHSFFHCLRIAVSFLLGSRRFARSLGKMSIRILCVSKLRIRQLIYPQPPQQRTQTLRLQTDSNTNCRRHYNSKNVRWISWNCFRRK